LTFRQGVATIGTAGGIISAKRVNIFEYEILVKRMLGQRKVSRAAAEVELSVRLRVLMDLPLFELIERTKRKKTGFARFAT